jgi:thiol:disulfide interchange protein DsbD
MMKRAIFNYGFWLFLIAMVLGTSVAATQKDTAGALQSDSPSASDVVQVKTAWSVDRARPGDPVVLAVVIDIKDGIHINADARQVQPFEDLKLYPTKVQIVAATEGVTIEAARFPQAIPVKVDYASGALMSFEGRTIIYLPMKLDAQINPGIIELELKVEYQACSDTYCLFPQKTRLKETLSVVESGAATSKINEELFANLFSGAMASPAGGVSFNLFGWQFSINTSSGFGWIVLLLTAALGGLLLNFTPCVLPLIPIKIISLSHAAENRKRCFLLGLVMSLGLLAFWIGLGILIAWVSDFTATNQLFQYPVFTLLVGSIIGIMALGMFGFFSIRLPQFIYLINPQQDSLRGSFALGILAAVLSTPCTAPFMGAAAAWAASDSKPPDHRVYFCRHRRGHGPAVSVAFSVPPSSQPHA